MASKASKASKASIKDIKNPNTYINNLTAALNSSSDIITVEHRSGNPKRDFLFVNKKQCKHIPCKPSDMIHLCSLLADNINDTLKNKYDSAYDNIKILIVGFAETATALGTIIGEKLDKTHYIMHTTREPDISNSVSVIRFKEEHSHAVNQELRTYIEAVDIIKDCNYVLFVDDEITTGNTIKNFIKEFEKVIGTDVNYGIASICNWQTSEAIESLSEYKPDIFCLLRGEIKDTSVKMFNDGEVKLVNNEYSIKENCGYDLIIIDTASDDSLFRKSRLGQKKSDIEKTEEYIKHVLFNIETENYNSVRIIGTEEFMEIPIYLGYKLESMGKAVVCHATTRSKIDVIKDEHSNEQEAIKNRIKLASAYEDGRDTYLYNTETGYDLTLLVTDSNNFEQMHKLASQLNTVFDKKTNKFIVIKFK